MSTNLTKEEAQKEIEKKLMEKGCTEVFFTDPKDDLLVVLFNCKELTSFTNIINGWSYSGIQIDSSKQRQYRINFKRDTVYNSAVNLGMAGSIN